jgi:hypothetical protein
MADYIFDRPIPGQSLTTEPKNFPWERPPEIVDPELALQFTLAKLNNPDFLENAVGILEDGLDLVTLVEGLLRMQVMEGIHTIEISMLIAPVVHEFIKTAADAAGIDYDEGFEDKKAKQKKMYSLNAVAARKKIEEMDMEPENVLEEVQEEVIEDTSIPMEEEEEPRGLMARRN